ncbi:rhomboid family intramembrane serine protease [Pendulispora brunnea]|uniref:Rhomboid family intramembrane serine protease n=1 Tax=Pendulispora brunnea TaxID=2905690 RepID=A0ABZ2K7F3_9BACT
MRAGQGRWQDRFSFGGRLPWAVGLLLSLTVIFSLAVAFGNRHTGPLFQLASLVPAGVWRGEVWRLVTWAFIEPSPLSLLFTCLGIYWFGSDLAGEWGSARFLRVLGGIVLSSAVVTCLLAQLDVALLPQHYLGSWACACAMIVAWGLWFPDRVVRIYFILPIRGYWLAWLTVGLTVVYAIYAGWERYLPELLAEGSMLAWIFRGTLTARLAKARQPAVRRPNPVQAKKRPAKGVSYLRVVEPHDDEDPPPMPADLEKRVQDLLRGTKRDD